MDFARAGPRHFGVFLGRKNAADEYGIPALWRRCSTRQRSIAASGAIGIPRRMLT